MCAERHLYTSKRRPGYFYWSVIILLWGGFALRVWDLGSTSFWVDEAVTDFRVQASVQQTLNYVAENASQGPFYYVALHLFPRDNELLLRFPSILAAMISIALIVFAAVQLYGRYKLALLAGLLLVCNPYHIWLSRMARAYSLFFMLSLCSSCFFLILLKGDRRPINWIVFTVSSMLAYVTHHFAFALPLTQYLLFAFILRGNRRFFRRWIAAQVIAGVPLIVWAYRLSRQETLAVGSGWIPTPGLEDIPLTLWNMMIGYEGTVTWYLVPGLMIAVLGLLAGFYYAFQERRKNRINWYWALLVVGPLALIFAVSVFFHPFYVDRYFVVLLPGIIFLMLNGWMHLQRVVPLSLLVGVVVAASLLGVVTVLDQGKAEREDWQGAMQYIQRNRQPSDGLLVEMPNKLLPVLYYLPDDEIDYAWLSLGLGSQESLVDQYETPVSRIWAVYRNPYDDGHRQLVMPDFDPFEPGDSPMPEWLAERREQVLVQKAFPGVTVILVDTRDEFANGGD